MDLNYEKLGSNPYLVNSLKNNKRVNFSKINILLIQLICLLIFLRPHFNFLPDVVSVYWPDGIIFLVTIIYLMKAKTIDKKHHSNSQSPVILEILCLILLFFPVAINQMVNGFYFEGIFSYLKIVYFYLFFWAVYSLALNTPEIFHKVEKVIFLSFIMNFFISIIQLMALPILSDITSLLYGTEKLRTIWTGYARVYGALYNANWFGVYLIFVLAWLNGKAINKKIMPSVYIISIVMLAIMLMISGSRTAIFAALVTCGVQLMRYANSKVLFKMVMIIFPVVFITLNVIGKIEILNRTFTRFSSTYYTIVNDGVKIENLAGSRWPEWLLSFEVFLDSPWFGNKAEFFIPHNSYISFLLGFGIIGTAIFIVFLLLINRRFKMLNKVNTKDFYHNKVFVGYLWGFAIASMAGDYWFSTQIMLILVLYGALLAASLKKKNKEYQKY